LPISVTRCVIDILPRLTGKRFALTGLVVALAAASILFLISLEPDPVTARGDSGECSSCHSGIKIYTLEADAPSEVVNGSDFRYTVAVENHDGSDGNPFDLNDIELSLEIGGENVTLAEGENATGTMPDLKGAGTGELSWQLRAISPGNVTLRAFVEGTAHYDHRNSKYPDDYVYMRKAPLEEITIKELAVRLTGYSFMVREGQEMEFGQTVTATENITDFAVWIPVGLESMLRVNSSHPGWTGTGIPLLDAGEQLDLGFNFTGNGSVTDDVVLSWRTSTGELQTIRIRFSVLGVDDDGDDDFPYQEISRYMGYISAVTMISLFISGSRFPALKKRMNTLFGSAALRLRIHCWVSGVALLVATVHSTLLIAWRDTLHLDLRGVPLGYISLALMALVALNGIFQRMLVRKFGFRKWHLFHLLGSIVALGCAVVHILILNTVLGFNL